MHLNQTEIAILKFFLKKIGKSFNIREISKGIEQDYRITYVTVERMLSKSLLTKEKKANLGLCKLEIKNNIGVLCYAENLAMQEFLLKNPDVVPIIGDILTSIQNPYFTLILFGSYAKGKAKKSDLDMLFLLPDRKFEENISIAVASAERVSPIKLHDVALSYSDFSKMLKEKKINLAKEAIDNHIIIYGCEAYYKILDVAEYG